jgi:DNA repair exonuclease SbcCD ATPase subunit
MLDKESDVKNIESNLEREINNLIERQEGACESDVINEIEDRLREISGKNTTIIKNLPPDNYLNIKTTETRVHLLMSYLSETYEVKVTYDENSTVHLPPWRGGFYHISPNE